MPVGRGQREAGPAGVAGPAGEVRATPQVRTRIADAQFHLARTWKIPKPQSDEELNLGVAALRAFIERFPTHKLASQAHLEIAQSYVERGRYDDAAAALRQFLADPRYQDREEIPDRPQPAGPLPTIAEEVPRGDRRLARLPGEASLRQAVERRAAGDHQHRIPDGRREAGGQAVRRRQPAVRRVPGEISARRARARHPAADEPQGRRGGEMGRGHRRLAADRLEISRFARRPRWPSSRSPTRWKRSSASWKRPWRNTARRRRAAAPATPSRPSPG